MWYLSSGKGPPGEGECLVALPAYKLPCYLLQGTQVYFTQQLIFSRPRLGSSTSQIYHTRGTPDHETILKPQLTERLSWDGNVYLHLIEFVTQDVQGSQITTQIPILMMPYTACTVVQNLTYFIHYLKKGNPRFLTFSLEYFFIKPLHGPSYI